MKFLLPFLILTCAAGFAPPTQTAQNCRHVVSMNAATKKNDHDHVFSSRPTSMAAATAATLTGAIVTSQLLFMEAAQAAAGDMEVADLPPPYVPVAFGIALLGGVGWLTSSLGDVMSDEASLGFQSGARAKKEMERSRSSYFKKK